MDNYYKLIQPPYSIFHVLTHTNIISPKSLKIVEYRKDNPHLTLQAIGDKFGISNQRVHYILKRADKNTQVG